MALRCRRTSQEEYGQGHWTPVRSANLLDRAQPSPCLTFTLSRHTGRQAAARRLLEPFHTVRPVCARAASATREPSVTPRSLRSRRPPLRAAARCRRRRRARKLGVRDSLRQVGSSCAPHTQNMLAERMQWLAAPGGGGCGAASAGAQHPSAPACRSSYGRRHAARGSPGLRARLSRPAAACRRRAGQRQQRVTPPAATDSPADAEA